MTTEADARNMIGQLLRDAGWDIAETARVSIQSPAEGGPRRLAQVTQFEGLIRHRIRT